MEAGTIPGQGAPAPASEQPPASGQGTQGDQGQQPPTGADGFRGNFTGIADDDWARVEPGLREVQGRITQMEQLTAPLRQAGVQSPEQVAGLAQFVQNYQNNPLGVFLDMAQMLQRNGVIDADLDVEELAAIAQGKAPSPAPGTEPVPGQPVPPGQEEVPQWAQAIVDRMDRQEQEQLERQQADQARQQQAYFQSALAQAKEALKEAGFPEDAISDQRITASIIANRGDLKAAIEDFTGLKETVLSSFAEQHGGPAPQTLPRGAPPTRPTPKPRPGRSGFDAANDQAKQFLAQQREASAQEG